MELPIRGVLRSGGARDIRGAPLSGGVLRGVRESPPPVYWHAPTIPNVPAQSSLPSLPSPPLQARNLAGDINIATYGEVFYSEVMKIIRQNNDRPTLLKELRKREHWRDKEFAFVISARVAMKERPKDALPIIFAELQQHLDTPTWHPVHWQSLSYHQRKSVI